MEGLELILQKLDEIQTEQRGMREEQQHMQADIQSMREEQQLMQADIQSIKAEQQLMKTDIQSIKAEQQLMQADIQSIKAEQQDMKADMQSLKAEQRHMQVEQQSFRTAVMLRFDQVGTYLSMAEMIADSILPQIEELQNLVNTRFDEFEMTVDYLSVTSVKQSSDISGLKRKLAEWGAQGGSKPVRLEEAK